MTHESSWEFARGAKVDEVHSPCRLVVQDIGEVGVRLQSVTTLIIPQPYNDRTLTETAHQLNERRNPLPLPTKELPNNRGSL